MQVQNTSARLWTIRGKINVLPGQTVEVPDEYAADVTGHQDLKIVEAKEPEAKEEKAKPGRKAKEAKEPEAKDLVKADAQEGGAE